MDNENKYSIHLDVKYQPLELIDIPSLVSTVTDQWFNQSLCMVNDCVVRLGVMRGEFHWHKHEQEDEFFFLLEGKFVIEQEDKTVTLAPQQGFMIPRGVLHRTAAPERSVILMIEKSTVKPVGD